MAAANSRRVRRSVAGDHSDHRLRLARPLVMARATTPWKRAWEGQRWLKMWESFQSAATGHHGDQVGQGKQAAPGFAAHGGGSDVHHGPPDRGWRQAARSQGAVMLRPAYR